MAKAIEGAKIRLKGVRLSFADLLEPRPFGPGQPPRYGATFILDPANAAHAAHIAEIKTAIKELGAKAFPDVRLAEVPLCLKDGNKKSYDGWKDMIVLTSSTDQKHPPLIVGRGFKPGTQELRIVTSAADPEAPYSGCYVNATVTLWAQNNSFGKRINGTLKAVQFLKDGPAFAAGAVDADDEFEPLDESATGPAADLDDFNI